jgi:hypothetical protein
MGNASGACMLHRSPGATEERTVELRLAVGARLWSGSGATNTALLHNALAVVDADAKGVGRGLPALERVVIVDEQAEGTCLATHRTKGTSTTYER